MKTPFFNITLCFLLILGSNPLYASHRCFSNTSNWSADSVVNPLADYSKEWTNPIYEQCNTAKDNSFLSTEEKNLIWILNMVRWNPQLFLSSVLLNPKCGFFKAEKKRNKYDLSLIKTLKSAEPIQSLLVPDMNCFESAQCHAISSGKKGYLGHDRISSNCKMDFYGECCQYGYSDGFSIVLDLLLDYDVPSYGHRKICLSQDYQLIGASIQPHTLYRFNTVIDFK